jgi:ABC-type glycerol-3-phosphate transport system permease component
LIPGFGHQSALALLIGTPAAYSPSRWSFRARRKIRRMTPPIAFATRFFLAYRDLHVFKTVANFVTS